MPVYEDRAIVITAAERAEVHTVERNPTPLGSDEVAGRTLYTLVSVGTEIAGVYQGSQFPATPGYAATFIVESAGAEVRDLKPGDTAFVMGPHRSFQRARRGEVLPLPDGASPQEALFARMMNVTMATLATTTARPPGKVVVTGLGPVGHIGAQVFARCGYTVLACDPAPSRRALMEAVGTCMVREGVPLGEPGWQDSVDLGLECSGHEAAALDLCRLVRKRGEVVLTGVPWKRRTELSAHDLLHTVFHRYVILRSGWEWELPLNPVDFRRGSIYGHLEAALRWIAEGRVQVAGLYETRPPNEAQDVYQELLHGQCEKLTAVFDWTGQDS